jgi:hypothetical protein
MMMMRTMMKIKYSISLKWFLNYLNTALIILISVKKAIFSWQIGKEEKLFPVFK